MASGSGAHTVTNEEFRRFVNATKYVTFAERPPNPEDYPGAYLMVSAFRHFPATQTANQPQTRRKVSKERSAKQWRRRNHC
jgi:formylglycine-generating enzyme required for sulfatase activity